MFGLTNLMNAFARLANAVNGLADTAEQVNTATRQRLQLDGRELPVNRLAGPAEEEAGSNGKRRGKS